MPGPRTESSSVSMNERPVPKGWTAAQHRAFSPDQSLDLSQAIAEADRCLQCFDPPCQRQCPASIAIPRFIRMIRSRNLRGAAEVVRSANPLANSCGVACPEEQYCAGACTRGKIDDALRIRQLHQFVTSQEERLKPRPASLKARQGKRVAVVGGGPAGMACAFELRRRGIAVVIYEARKQAGGVLTHSIPLYRFGRDTFSRDAQWILSPAPTAGRARRKAASIEIKTGKPMDSFEKLSRTFDAVFVSPGASAHHIPLKGCDLRGVSTAVEFLETCRRRRYRNRVGNRVVVIGGGNVAVDAALAAVRCGLERLQCSSVEQPQVHLAYRRSRLEMPAWDREIREAEEAGVHLHLLAAPLEILGHRGRASGLRLQQVKLSVLDATGRRTPVPIPGTEFELPCDQILLATGMGLDAIVRKLPCTRTGWLRSHPRTGLVRGNIYAGGDATGSDQSIVAAVRDGKSAAEAIARRLGRDV